MSPDNHLTQANDEPYLRTCPGCGNQSPAETPRCEHCGLSSIDVAFAEHKADSERRFLQALFNRSNPFTMIFIGINAGVFVLMCLAGGFSAASADPAVLLGFGAKENSLIAGQHQYWRLITSIFIHIGFIHLFLNNYALWIIGQEIERIYGSARFVVLYLLTGAAGSIGSYVFNPDATSAGASGAIFGLFGVMATFAFRYRREIPESLSREIKRRVLPIIAINLVFGFSVRIVDNAAHIGGLLTGVALALAVPYKRPQERITPAIWRALHVICLAVVLVSFISAFRAYNGPRLSFSNLAKRPGSTVVEYYDQMQEARRRLGESMEFRSTRLDPGSDAGIKPAIEAVEQGIRAVNAAPRIDSETDRYRNRLVELLEARKDILDRLARTSSKNRSDLVAEEEMLRNRYGQFRSDYGGWIPGFLKEHGYTIGKANDR